jgi:hypothetical protein
MAPKGRLRRERETERDGLQTASCPHGLEPFNVAAVGYRSSAHCVAHTLHIAQLHH